MSSKHIVVTGSSGMIGTRLCEYLMAKGYKVTGVDRRKNKWNPEVEKITVRLDLRNKKKVLSLLPKKVDYIIHLAANARVYNLVVTPDLARDNFETTFNTLEYARKVKPKGFLFASSREVYGNSKKITHAEDESYVKHCESPYTASKLGGEALVHSYGQCYGLDFVIFRLSNVYGMYDDSDRIMPLFIERALLGKDLTVFGKDKVLDFTYIDDAIHGIFLALTRFEKAKNQVFNFASGKGSSLVKLAEVIKARTRSNSKIHIAKNRTGEVVKYIANINKAKKMIGYHPSTDFYQGVDKALHWYIKFFS